MPIEPALEQGNAPVSGIPRLQRIQGLLGQPAVLSVQEIDDRRAAAPALNGLAFQIAQPVLQHLLRDLVSIAPGPRRLTGEATDHQDEKTRAHQRDTVDGRAMPAGRPSS